MGHKCGRFRLGDIRLGKDIIANSTDLPGTASLEIGSLLSLHELSVKPELSMKHELSVISSGHEEGGGADLDGVFVPAENDAVGAPLEDDCMPTIIESPGGSERSLSTDQQHGLWVPSEPPIPFFPPI